MKRTLLVIAVMLSVLGILCSCSHTDGDFSSTLIKRIPSEDGDAEKADASSDEPLVWADKTYLYAVIDDCGKYKEEDYTKTSYAAFEKEVEKARAVAADDTVEQEEADSTAHELAEAYKLLMKRADFSETEKLLERLEKLDRSCYTESALGYLDEAVEKAKEMIDPDSSQKTSDEAFDLLSEAVHNLACKPVESGEKGKYVNRSVFPSRGDGTEFEMSEATEKKFSSAATARLGMGYFVLDLETGANLTFNADIPQFQASTAKAQFCLYMYSLIDSGKASFDDELEYKEKHYSVGSGEIKNTPFGSKYKLSYLINRALTISDNCAFHMMVDNYDYREYNKFIKALGCKYAGEVLPGAHFGSSSPRDTIKIWTEIYTYTRYGANGEQFRGYLEESAYNSVGEGIPEYDVAHKSGWTSAQFNDFAIVYAPHPYLVVTYLPVVDGSERKLVTKFSDAVNDVLSEYHDYIYADDEFFLHTLEENDGGEDAQKTDKESKKQ